MFTVLSFDYSSNYEQLIAENKRLRNDLDSLEREQKKALDELLKAYDTISKFRSEIELRDEALNTLQLSNKAASEAADRLNKALNDNRKRYKKKKPKF